MAHDDASSVDIMKNDQPYLFVNTSFSLFSFILFLVYSLSYIVYYHHHPYSTFRLSLFPSNSFHLMHTFGLFGLRQRVEAQGRATQTKAILHSAEYFSFSFQRCASQDDMTFEMERTTFKFLL